MSRVAIPLQHQSRQAWGAVFALSLAAFALVASEFMPVSLLTPIAADLNITASFGASYGESMGVEGTRWAPESEVADCASRPTGF
jgi:hypothetical protein